MQTKYTIHTDPRRQLVHLRLAGQWDQTTLADYRRDLATAMHALSARGGKPGDYLILIDLRAQGVQTKEVAAEHQAIIVEYVPLARRRAVVMSESALHAMQVRRISPTANVNIFHADDEALDWLLS